MKLFVDTGSIKEIEAIAALAKVPHNQTRRRT